MHKHDQGSYRIRKQQKASEDINNKKNPYTNNSK